MQAEKTQRQKSMLGYAIVIIAFLLISLSLYSLHGVPDDYEWKVEDARENMSNVKSIASGKKSESIAPFIFRIGNYFLVSNSFGNTHVEQFFYTNLLACLIFSLLMYYFLNLFINRKLISLGLTILFITHWRNPVRFNFFSPVDLLPWTLVLFLAGLILIELYRRSGSISILIFLSAVSFIGVFFNEILISIPAAFLFFNDPIVKGDRSFKSSLSKLIFGSIAKYLPMICALIGVIVINLIFHPVEYRSYLSSYGRSLFSSSVVQHIHALFIVTGPVIALSIFYYKKIFSFLFSNQYMAIILIVALTFALMNSENAERYYMLMMPVIFLLTGIVLEGNSSLIKKASFIIAMIFLQSLTNRIYFPIESEELTGLGFPILTLIGSGKFNYLLSTNLDWAFTMMSLVQYIIVICAILFILKYFKQESERVVKQEDLI